MKMDIEGGERSVIPSNLDIIKCLNYLDNEIHEGLSTEPIPYLKKIGFEFKRISNREYLFNDIKQAFSLP